MNAALLGNEFLIKEQVGLFRAANHYDVFDTRSDQPLLECREQNLRPWVKLCRFAFVRRTPFDIQVRTPEGQPLLRVHRGPTLLAPKVTVRDEKDRVLGVIRQWFFALVEKFDVLDEAGRPLGLLRRSLGGREFQLLGSDGELARITKRWAGWGRELFTSADTYELTISARIQPDDPLRLLALGAVISVDMLLYE